jgi:hypothetical protein
VTESTTEQKPEQPELLVDRIAVFPETPSDLPKSMFSVRCRAVKFQIIGQIHDVEVIAAGLVLGSYATYKKLTAAPAGAS